MVGIQRVGSLDNHTIDIQFTNAHVLLLDLNHLSDPQYQRIVDNGEWSRPKTDGQSIWWNDGPRLSIVDLMHILTEKRGERR